MKKLFLILILYIVIFIKPDLAYAQDKASASSAKIFAEQNYSSDTRTKILENYLKRYDSPLTGEAKTFVKYADQYQLDWKLVAAISGLESTFGKQIPYNSYNGWGWGIYGDNTIYFRSWGDGIKTVSEGLRTNYINKWGATNVYEIGRLYAASPTWAQRVDYLMRNIADFQLRSPQSTLPLSI
ncbi:MAG TPA: hypothetical protein VKC89_02345 [Patescibacteria group bacterium]|nr:hypothetical protein [Patescibacteria group bacterium]